VFWVHPMGGNFQERTSFSTHLATDGSSAEQETFCGVPSGPMARDTFTFTVGRVVGFRSQHERLIAGW